MKILNIGFTLARNQKVGFRRSNNNDGNDFEYLKNDTFEYSKKENLNKEPILKAIRELDEYLSSSDKEISSDIVLQKIVEIEELLHKSQGKPYSQEEALANYNKQATTGSDLLELIVNKISEFMNIYKTLTGADDISQTDEESAQPVSTNGIDCGKIEESFELDADDVDYEDYVDKDLHYTIENELVDSYEKLAIFEKSKKAKAAFIDAAFEAAKESCRKDKDVEVSTRAYTLAKKCMEYSCLIKSPSFRRKWFGKAYHYSIVAFNSVRSDDPRKSKYIVWGINAAINAELNSQNPEIKENWREKVNETMQAYLDRSLDGEKIFILNEKIKYSFRYAQNPTTPENKEKWKDQAYEDSIALSGYVDKKRRMEIIAEWLKKSQKNATETESVELREKWQDRVYYCYEKTINDLPPKEQLKMAEIIHTLLMSYSLKAESDDRKTLWETRAAESRKKIVEILSKIKE